MFRRGFSIFSIKRNGCSSTGFNLFILQLIKRRDTFDVIHKYNEYRITADNFHLDLAQTSLHRLNSLLNLTRCVKFKSTNDSTRLHDLYS